MIFACGILITNFSNSKIMNDTTSTGAQAPSTTEPSLTQAQSDDFDFGRDSKLLGVFKFNPHHERTSILYRRQGVIQEVKGYFVNNMKSKIFNHSDLINLEVRELHIKKEITFYQLLKLIPKNFLQLSISEYRLRQIIMEPSRSGLDFKKAVEGKYCYFFTGKHSHFKETNDFAVFELLWTKNKAYIECYGPDAVISADSQMVIACSNNR